MVQRRQRERSLFEVLLPDGHKLWPDWLRKIDTLLEDEGVIEAVAQGLEARWPQSRRRGRPGTPAEVVLRMLILKHLFDWSYDDLEREVRANLVYRMFTRIDAGDVPDAKTILKIARALGPDVIEQLHRQVIEVAKRAGVTHGRRFRVDTTVVETNVHYPTDSTLLQDGMRVLTRTMQRASTALGDRPGRIRNRLRSVTRRVLIIGYEARSPKTRAALVKSYRKLMATTRAVLRDTATMVRRLGQRVRTASPQVQPMLQRAQDQLQAMRPLVQRVVNQTRARLLGGDTHVPDKVLSVFEPHTETIRKGKIAKPNEFGKLVTIQESEHQIITGYDVHPTRPADVTGDRGSASAGNEQAAIDRGVRRVILPRRGPKSPARRAYERQRWFRRGQRWRVGCEGRISVLKRRHGLDRCRYHGDDGMHRWVGLGVIANNLVSTATFSSARATA
jgi:IS5 family transposase